MVQVNDRDKYNHYQLLTCSSEGNGESMKVGFVAMIVVAICGLCVGVSSADDIWSPLYGIRLTQAVESIGIAHEEASTNEWGYGSIETEKLNGETTVSSDQTDQVQLNGFLSYFGKTCGEKKTCNEWRTCIQTCDLRKHTCKEEEGKDCTFRGHTCSENGMTCIDTCKISCNAGACADTNQQSCKVSCRNGRIGCCPNNQLYELNV
jgi:hypothetical protein